MAPFVRQSNKAIFFYFTKNCLQDLIVSGYRGQIQLHHLTLLKNSRLNHMQIWFSLVSLAPLHTISPLCHRHWSALGTTTLLYSCKESGRIVQEIMELPTPIPLFSVDTTPWFSSASGQHCYMSSNNTAAEKPGDQSFKVILTKTPLCPTCVPGPAHHQLPSFPHTVVEVTA